VTLKIAVVVATTGRAATAGRTLGRLRRQTRQPDRAMVVAVTPADVAGLDQAAMPLEIRLTERGLCRQRNEALSLLGESVDLVAFFDDDFLPADDYLENLERLFLAFPEVIGATGRLIADGAGGAGLTFEQAEALLAADTFDLDWANAIRERRGLYGCNMAYRVSAIAGMKFDENLPLYGWQEDIDFSFRLRDRGRRVVCDALAGVHLGEKGGRTSGRRFGYSQVANPFYLLGKGSIPRDRARRIMVGNLAANAWGAIRPEPYVDRRGRLVGNLIAIRDLLAGRLHPRRMLDLQ
jgi:GT2 family glycosyltransferase